MRVAVRGVVAEAVERARRGEGPTLIEAKTYRYFGHSHSDPRAYRTRDEEAAWKARDPITVLGREMVDLKLLTEAELDGLDETVQDKLAAAVRICQGLARA